MKRRHFIQASLAAASATMLPSFSFKEVRPVGLQLYSLRDVIKNDVKGTLKQVSDWGYKNLETFGYDDGMLFGMKSSEVASIVSDMGMRITSGHYLTGLARPNVKGSLVNEWERAIHDAKEANQEYMIIAYLDEGERKSLDDYKKVCALINKGAEMCRKFGIRLGYHNHSFEFNKIDNEIPYHVMLKELDSNLVAMEMDIFWIVSAGRDPLEYFNQYPGRFEQWHVKDMDKTDPTKNADVGTGKIDFKPIFAKAGQAGLRNFYIEQETYPVSSSESVKNSIANLKKWI
jgi:sugar phosphate isomerase/epimerase